MDIWRSVTGERGNVKATMDAVDGIQHDGACCEIRVTGMQEHVETGPDVLVCCI
jgi:hypothetical protein